MKTHVAKASLGFWEVDCMRVEGQARIDEIEQRNVSRSVVQAVPRKSYHMNKETTTCLPVLSMMNE